MGRVSKDTLKKLNAFIDSLPDEAREKCSLCNETLTHIVKQAEAQTGATTATVSRVLANKINEGAAPLDVISSEAVRGRVRQKENDRNKYGHNDQINKMREPKTFEWDKAIGSLLSQIVYVRMAIDELANLNQWSSRRQEAIEAINGIIKYINDKK